MFPSPEYKYSDKYKECMVAQTQKLTTMTEITLRHIKEDIQRFLPVITGIANYFNTQPVYKLLEVLIQNVAFDGSNCQGYSHEKEVEKVKEIEKLILNIKNYSMSYVEEYVYNELFFSILGNQYVELEH